MKAIVNCAAWTNVDACETDEKLAALAEKLNAEAPENLAKAMKEVDLHTHLIWLMPSSPYWIRLRLPRARMNMLEFIISQTRVSAPGMISPR